MSDGTPKGREQVYAVVRLDPGYEVPFTVKEIVWSAELAQAEVERLNKLNAERGTVYIWQATRLYPPDKSVGSDIPMSD